MSRWQDRAYRLRWLLLLGAIGCWAGGALWVLNPYWPRVEFGWLEPQTPAGLVGVLGYFVDDGGVYLALAATYLGALLLAQWCFLAPRRWWRVNLTATGRPMKRSILAASLMAAMLTVGLLAALLELPGWWESLLEFMPRYGQTPGSEMNYWPGVIALAVAWALWGVIFTIYWRQGDRYTQLGRMVRGLIAGSILELIVCIPAHVWVMRQRDCYCVRGTYTGLVFAGTVLLWAFGPALILLFLREKYRRQQLLPACPACDYDLRGSVNAGATHCPECGAAIPAAMRPAQADQDNAANA